MDLRDGGGVGFAVLKLEELDDREGHNLDEAGVGVDVLGLEGHHASWGLDSFLAGEESDDSGEGGSHWCDG